MKGYYDNGTDIDCKCKLILRYYY